VEHFKRIVIMQKSRRESAKPEHDLESDYAALRAKVVVLEKENAALTAKSEALESTLASTSKNLVSYMEQYDKLEKEHKELIEKIVPKIEEAEKLLEVTQRINKEKKHSIQRLIERIVNLFRTDPSRNRTELDAVSHFQEDSSAFLDEGRSTKDNRKSTISLNTPIKPASHITVTGP
jgi:chromosome segregation ATPase